MGPGGPIHCLNLVVTVVDMHCYAKTKTKQNKKPQNKKKTDASVVIN